MLKRLFNSLFNSADNTIISKSETAGNAADTAEEKLSQWLAHPAEYNQRPTEVTLIEKNYFSVNFIPGSPPMQYSLLRYKMTPASKYEIAIVDQLFTWSFMNVIDYEQIEPLKIKTAYFGKLCELIHARLQISTGGVIPYSKEEESKKVVRLFESKGILGTRVADIHRFNEAITFFVVELTENGRKFYMPGSADFSANEYYVEQVIMEDDPFLPLALYHEMGNILAQKVE